MKPIVMLRLEHHRSSAAVQTNGARVGLHREGVDSCGRGLQGTCAMCVGSEKAFAVDQSDHLW